jgi:tetratricopeptide (TPR) repeat protein/tRNA A-37 threonylcarbamoyl transferase component Bud32
MPSFRGAVVPRSSLRPNPNRRFLAVDDLQSQLQATLSGAYTIERELGGGGMSRVFVADEVRLGRKVVVKLLSPELAAGISAERFEREIRTAASLQQANIVPVLATGETDGLPYYTMPFVEGESLRHRLSTQPPLSISDIVRILGDVARALQYAHDRGIVHRDIKPDNVLLSGGTAVVTDFGIAKALSDSRTRVDGSTLTQLGTSIGTPAYMAPEQAAGDPNIDRRADIYAFGCMAFELLAGRTPFHGRTPARILGAHMGEAPPQIAELRPDAPAALSDLTMRCLAKDPEARPQTAAEIIAALNGVTSGSGMQSMPPVLLHGPAAFRRALLLYAVSVVAVAAIAKAATVTIGLPTWVLPGSLFVMALGLPVILFTGYVQSVTRRALLSTPALTPGGGQAPHGTMATIALKASPHLSWKRTTRGGLIALGGFAALIVGFMMMRAFGIGPVGSLFAAGKLNQRDVVLVSDFGVSRADSSVASVVAEGVRANLAESKSLKLFGQANVAQALQRMQVAPTSRLDLTLARQVALREGAKAIVTGDVTGLGNGFVIALKLVSADSGAVLAAFQTTVDGPSTLVSGVDELTRKLRGKIGESLKSVQSSPPLEQVTTSSYEALKAYSEGARAFDIEHDMPKAIPLLRRAVAIDTGFATAWRKLGTALNNSFYSPAAAESATTKAYQLRARLSENERYLAEGYYFQRGAGRNRPRAIAAYQALLDRGDTAYAANNMGVAYTSMRDYAKAESLYRMSMRVNPDNNIPLPNLINVLVDQGKRAAVDSMMELEAKRLPNSASHAYHVTGIPYVNGEYDRAEQLLDSIHRTSKNLETRVGTSAGIAELLAVRGRLRESERRYQQMMSESAELGNSNPAAADSANLVVLDAWFRNQGPRAVARLDAALAAHPLSALPQEDRPYGLLARVYSAAGRPDRARAILADFTGLKDTSFVRRREPMMHQALGEIALAERRYGDAITEFRRGDLEADGRPTGGEPLRIHFNLGRAFDLSNQTDSAIAHFEAYVQTPEFSRIDTDVDALAGIHKRLGELYDAKGDREKAISHLSKFVELWKNADPELQPAVADAKRRLTKLQAGGKS